MKSKLSFSGSWPFQNSRSMHSIDVIAQPVIPCSTGVGHVQNKHTNYVFLICSRSHMKKASSQKDISIFSHSGDITEPSSPSTLRKSHLPYCYYVHLFKCCAIPSCSLTA